MERRGDFESVTSETRRPYPELRIHLRVFNAASSVDRLRIGEVPIDVLSFDQALDAIVSLATSGRGGYVVTPNIDHVVLAESHAEFREAYQGASLSLVDGMPLLWASRLLGVRLPQKISGADLVEPLMRRSCVEGLRVYLLGAGPGVAMKAGEVLHARHGVDIVGCDGPQLSLARDAADTDAALARVRAARPHLLLLALGAPKQEILMRRFREAYAPAVALGIGASLDFIAGTVRRAPAWLSRAGLEWAWRLSREPKRLWRRYLLNDPKFIAILARSVIRRRR
jgi:N-acetylglucosaminyldiphosphoundecaprenol N-acetyl-beta-D-mannosaminyltransferase